MKQVALIIRWRNAIVDDGSLSWRAKYTGLALSRWMDGDGRGAWPSVAKLSALMACSESTVQRGLRELERSGWLWAGITPGKTTRYDALLPRGVRETPLSETPPIEPVSDRRQGVSERASTGVSRTPEVEVLDLDQEQARAHARAAALDRRTPDPAVVNILHRARRGDFVKGVE